MAAIFPANEIMPGRRIAGEVESLDDHAVVRSRIAQPLGYCFCDIEIDPVVRVVDRFAVKGMLNPIGHA